MISMILLYIEFTKKLYNMHISVFWWGQGRQEIIFRMWAVASDSRKKTVRNAVNRGVVRSSKMKFFETFCLISQA